MEQARVSIVTASFNFIEAKRKETFLQMCQSVQQQSYPDIEHVIIDGDSQDGSLEYIKAYAQKYKNVKYLSKKDSGIYQAFNRGVHLASGKYILILGTDDFYHDETGIARAVKMTEEKNIDGVFSAIHKIDECGKIVIHEPRLQKALRVIPFPPEGFLIKRKCILDMGGFNEKYKIASDYELIRKHILHGKKIVFIKNSFASFRGGGRII